MGLPRGGSFLCDLTAPQPAGKTPDIPAVFFNSRRGMFLVAEISGEGVDLLLGDIACVHEKSSIFYDGLIL